MRLGKRPRQTAEEGRLHQCCPWLLLGFPELEHEVLNELLKKVTQAKRVERSSIFYGYMSSLLAAERARSMSGLNRNGGGYEVYIFVRDTSIHIRTRQLF